MNPDSKISLPVLCLIILSVCFVSFFVHNDAIPADLMESRNLVTAREMVNSGNYLIPTMNGELRLEKPPLPTWIAAVIEQAFPHNLAAQRSAAGVAATIMVLFLFLLVRTITGETFLAFMAALVLATCYNPVMMGRNATWDIYCHAFMLGAIYFIWGAFKSEGKQWLRFLLAGFFMGLSFLSKGPVSFYALLLPFLIAFIIVEKPSLKGKTAPFIGMILLTLIVSFWWPAYIAAFHPETGSAVAAKESGAWLSHNVRPLWYYWQFPAEAGIWALFWVTSLFYYFHYFRKEISEPRNIFRLSVIWTLAALILLSLIPEKKPRYLLPMLIPGAINIAFYLWYSMKNVNGMSKGEKIVLRINGTLIAVISLIMPIGIYFLAKDGHIDLFFHLILPSFVFWAIAIYLFIGLYGKKGIFPNRIFLGTVLIMMSFILFYYQPVTRLFVNENRHSISALRDDPKVQGLPFRYPEEEGTIRMELVYEAGRSITPIDLKNDSAVYAALPFVLVSEKPAPDLLENLEVTAEYLGTFDNNWQKPDSHRYNKSLTKEVYLVKKK
ncbi:ArnT family glycosyltransferase [Anaerorudis cellulosivorans]|uniref:ArnT family glycosyltransferase n=1 Tax=Anaerorudis cellulosivorans TaxID=3397862 RepID=UPI002220AB61|nr:glycosyltransferase family 39 protein [Seramator thermalis]MCW1734837.1 glycosyltransferase family 39 protein [Seramator thermalis]